MTMNVFPAIEGSSCYRYNNALHMSFHDHMHQVFAGYLEDYLKKLNLTQAIVDEYGDDVEVEQDLNRKSSANTNTIKMDEEDAERDRLLSVMFYMVSNGLKASKAAVKAAAQQLDVVLRPYKGAQGAADDAETSLIKGLILDLRKEENTAAVTTLGLDATVDELEEANNNFEAAKNKRTSERALTEGDNLKDARSKTDTVYQNMCTLISAAALMAATPEDLEFVVSVINEMNRVIANHKTSYTQSQAQKKSNKPEEGETVEN